MNKIFADVDISVNEEGYLTDFSQWTKDIAIEMAKEEGIELTDDHWNVLGFLQEQYKNEAVLSIRKIGKSGIISIKEFYTLFPNGPLKISSKLAGIPKPKSCI